MRQFTLLLLIPLLLISCDGQVTVMPPISTPHPLSPTPTFTPSPIPTVTPAPRTWSTPRIVTTFSPDVSITPPAFVDGRLYLKGNRLVDLNEYLVCGSLEISYSPSYDHFLVVVQCWEGQNEAFVFRTSDGIGQKITGGWDTIHGSHYSWSPDGQSLLYYRLAQCCADTVPELPTGLVLYNLPTGNKVFLTRYWNFPILPDWSPDGHWLAYLVKCRILLASSDGYNLWEIDNILGCAEGGSLKWESTSRIEPAVLEYTSSTSESRTYMISHVAGTLPTDKAIPVSLGSVPITGRSDF